MFPRVRVPTAFDPKFTGLEIVNVVPPFIKKDAEPPAESPRIIALAEGPAAPLVEPVLPMLVKTVPLFIAKLPENVF